MRESINGLPTNPRGQMTNAKRQVVKVEAPVLALRDPIHEAQGAARRGQVDLHAAAQSRAVSGFIVTGKKRIDRLPLALLLLPLGGCLPPSVAIWAARATA